MIVGTCKAFKAGLAALTLLGLAAITPAPIRSQVAGASLSGTVSDPSGAPWLVRRWPLKTWRPVSAETRRLTLVDSISHQTYCQERTRSQFSAPGFATQVRKGITLTVGGQQTLNFEMKVGGVNEKVEVTGEAPFVQTTSSDISAVVNSTTVRELPLNGRSWTDLTTLQPGVTRIETAFNAAAGADRGERGFGTQLSISRGKPVQNNYRLDGVSVNDFANDAPGSVLGVSLGVDAIQKFSVITTNYSADYGRTSGGVVHAITRSGTTEFHGSAFEFICNSALDARNFFDLDPSGCGP
jgi:hypothetical protein